MVISTVGYVVLSEGEREFGLVFNQTARTVGDLVGLGCLVEGGGSRGQGYSGFVHAGSSRWIAYLLGGLFTFLLIMMLKSCLTFKFDSTKAKYNHHHNISNYNYSNYLTFHLLISILINQHFQFFNLIFYTMLPACLGTKFNRVYSSV